MQRPKQLRSIYSVNGKVPGFTADFIRNKYPGHSSLSSAITHARSSNATMTDGYGPELVTNGGFDSDVSGWTATGVIERTRLGRLRLYGASLTPDRYIHQTLTTVSGKTYLVTVDLREESGGSSRGLVRVGTSGANSTDLLSSSYFGEGSQTFTFIATGTSSTLTLFWDDSGTSDYSEWDNVSVREMPVLKWAPHNLLTYSEDFSNAAWTKSQTSVTVNQTTAPNGTLTADLVTYTTNSAAYIAKSVSSLLSEHPYSVGFYVKRNSKSLIQWLSTGNSNYYANFDIENGTLGSSGSLVSNESITDVGDNWYFCSFTVTLDSNDAGMSYRIYGIDSLTDSYAAGSTSGGSLYLWGAHLYRSDLGGMVDNPERGDSYVPTAVSLTGSNLVQNGDFATDSEWTKGTGWTISGGVASVDSVANSNPTLSQDIGATNDFYAVTLDVISTNGTGVLEVYHINLGASISFDISSTGTKTVYLSGGTHASNGQISLRARGGFIGSIDNVSVLRSAVKPNAARFLPRIGHHVFNGDAWVNEGVLAESEQRVNLWLYSNDPTDAAWSFANDVTRPTSASLAGPDGQTSGYSLIPTTAGSSHYVSQSFSLTSGNDYTLSFYLKENGYRYAQIIIGGAYSADDYANFDLQDGVIGDVSTAATATIQDVGNGWFRCSCTFPADATATGHSGIGFIESLTDGRVPIFAGDGTSGIYVYGAQLEQASTPSSYIPTSTQQGTREAESFTIPSANLPWPTPQYIGDELVTDISPSAWTASGSNTVTQDASGNTVITYVDSSNGADFLLTTANGGLTQNLVSGKLYEFSVTLDTGGDTIGLLRATSLTPNYNINVTTSGFETFTHIFMSDGSELFRVDSMGAGEVATISSVSVREISPLSVSIAMEGRMTYADTSSTSEVTFVGWPGAGSQPYIRNFMRTNGSYKGALLFKQYDGSTADNAFESVPGSYSPDILVPYNIASRHGSTFVNGAIDGVALTADTTPVALPDLSSTDLNLAYDYMGTISEFRVWDKDIGDAGIVEATNPSLEPSLSLEFSGLANSFVVNDWSE